MAGASLAVPPACDISREPQRKEKGKTLRDRRLYLLSLSRLSTSNCSPYKWCFSPSHLIVAAHAGWNARSDNNMRFQLNSPMHDLCLRDCFLLQSEVLKTPTCLFLPSFFFCLRLTPTRTGVSRKTSSASYGGVTPGCRSRVVSPDRKLQSARSKEASSVYWRKQPRPPRFPVR